MKRNYFLLCLVILLQSFLLIACNNKKDSKTVTAASVLEDVMEISYDTSYGQIFPINFTKEKLTSYIWAIYDNKEEDQRYIFYEDNTFKFTGGDLGALREYGEYEIENGLIKITYYFFGEPHSNYYKLCKVTDGFFLDECFIEVDTEGEILDTRNRIWNSLSTNVKNAIRKKDDVEIILTDWVGNTIDDVYIWDRPSVDGQKYYFNFYKDEWGYFLDQDFLFYVVGRTTALYEIHGKSHHWYLIAFKYNGFFGLNDFEGIYLEDKDGERIYQEQRDRYFFAWVFGEYVTIY
jgi:hypothetical protein